MTLLSLSGVMYSVRTAGVPFHNGVSNKTRMFQRYQILELGPQMLLFVTTLFEIATNVFIKILFTTAFKARPNPQPNPHPSHV